MINSIQQDIFRIGTNDRKKVLFENNWPLPKGICYNSYFIDDREPALLDTVEFGSCIHYMDEVGELLHGRDLSYLIINHMEPDHAGMIADIVKSYPRVKIAGNARTLSLLEAYFGIHDRLMEVKEGSSLNLGKHNLHFIPTPMLHWPESMFSYESTQQILFSADAFGSFGCLEGGIFDFQTDFSLYEDEMLRYFANILGKYSVVAQRTLAKLAPYPVRIICPLHGPVWKEHPERALALYDKWSHHKAERGLVIAFASMYGNTEEMADTLAVGIADKGLGPIRMYDVSKTHVSFILRDIWKYRGVVLASCSYNGGMHPMMQQLCHELTIAAPKNKILALLGSYSWSGGGLRSLQAFAKEIGWSLIDTQPEISGALTGQKSAILNRLSCQIAEKLL